MLLSLLLHLQLVTSVGHRFFYALSSPLAVKWFQYNESQLSFWSHILGGRHKMLLRKKTQQNAEEQMYSYIVFMNLSKSI